MLRHIRTALLMLLFLSLITGVVYPLFVLAVGQVVFPSKANGSVVSRNGQPVGSSLVAQPFISPGYFRSRPSATSPFPYNGSCSTGSNYGPLNPDLLNAVKRRVDLLRVADPGNVMPVPVDLVTASGSGLDPHITVAAALYQLPRVAREREISEAEIYALLINFTELRTIGVLGEPGVNVLHLNLALDELSKEKK